MNVLSSMRSRLTLWYTSVLALVLLIFALTSYSYLAKAARQRTEASLSDTLDSLISTFNTELNDEGQTIAVSAQEAAMGLHFHDRQLIVYDSSSKVFVTSDTPHDLSNQREWFLSTSPKDVLVGLVREVGDGRVYRTLNSGEHELKAVASRVPAKQANSFSNAWVRAPAVIHSDSMVLSFANSLRRTRRK